MDWQTILGCLIIASALGVLTFLVLCSRRRIDRIARNGYGSARDIVKELDGDES